MADQLAIVVLTFNSAAIIEQTIGAAGALSCPIIAVDSGSTDGTVQILRRLGCSVFERPFTHYADQRNWTIDNLGNKYTWQLHLDADEVLDRQALEAIDKAVAYPEAYAGFLLHRRTYFLGRPLRYGGASSWHLRLFRSGTGRCEDRLYDQHFLCSGTTRQLDGWMHDRNASSLTEWIGRHNRWSELEARETLRSIHTSVERLQGRLGGDPRQRRRAFKDLYYRAPRYQRAWLYFLFRYVVQLGFLDGRIGFLYAFFQALWFRMLVDAKLLESEHDRPANCADDSPSPHPTEQRLLRHPAQ